MSFFGVGGAASADRANPWEEQKGFVSLTPEAVAQLAGLASAPSPTEEAAQLKRLLDRLDSVAPSSPLTPDTLPCDPQLRMKKVAALGTVNLHVRQIVLSLISLERDFLAVSRRETELGMDLCEGIDLMEACGIKAVNNGFNWIFQPTLPRNLDSPESFAFYWPLYLHLANNTLSSNFTHAGLVVEMGWDPAKLRHMEGFLHQAVNHPNDDVKALAKGFLAMLAFNFKAQESMAVYTKELYPLLLGLDVTTDFFKDDEFLRLLPICAPVLYQLMICDLRDLYSLKVNEVRQSGGNRDEFRREVYEPKLAWHAFAKGAYIDAQNSLYSLYFRQLSRGRDARTNRIFKSRILLSDLSFSKTNPYPDAGEAKAESVAKTRKKGKKKTPAKITKSAPSISTTFSSPPANMVPVFLPRWVENPFPFTYHRRVLHWLRMPKKTDPGYETQRIKHGFHTVVDKLIREETFSYCSDEKRKHSYYLIAQLDFANGTSERGVISYGTFGSDENEKCYHRHFSQRKNDQFLQKTLKRVFEEIPDEDTGDEWKEADESIKMADASERMPRIDIDPLLGFVKIHDIENGVVISIFKMPDDPSSSND